MARNSKPTARIEYVSFDVFYEDGTRTSNRKILLADVSGLEGDLPAQAFFEAQDKEIEHRSGRAKPKIASVVRSKV
jgi:hypothetical protein